MLNYHRGYTDPSVSLTSTAGIQIFRHLPGLGQGFDRNHHDGCLLLEYTRYNSSLLIMFTSHLEVYKECQSNPELEGNSRSA
jgi:hypothetical protein